MRIEYTELDHLIGDLEDVDVVRQIHYRRDDNPQQDAGVSFFVIVWATAIMEVGDAIMLAECVVDCGVIDHHEPDSEAEATRKADAAISKVKAAAAQYGARLGRGKLELY